MIISLDQRSERVKRIISLEASDPVKSKIIFMIRPSPFFFVYCRTHFLILGRSVGKRKKNTKIKLENCLELGGPVPQRHIRGA